MSFQLFDRIGAWIKQLGVYRHENLFTNQSNLLRIMAGGEFLDFSNQNALLQQTNLQINRLERYKDFDQMDEVGEITLALDMYADESCLASDVHVPLLDGTCPTIKELADKGQNYKFWVYAFDLNTMQYVPALAHGARISGYNVKLVEVKLDDGSSIRCTPDHLFLMKDGTYREAQDLKPYDSLMPLYKKAISKNNHKVISKNNHKVISVVDCGVADKVYDIEVPGYHNFAAGTKNSWVIVHNSLLDPERKRTLMVRAKSARVKEELEELFHRTLMIEDWVRPAVRYLCKYGDLPAEIVPDHNREGVSQLRHMNVYNFTRVETKYGDLVGFFYQDELSNEPTFFHPWQIMHARLTSFESIYHPYGRCVKFDSMVDTTLGPKMIKDITTDDIVYSYDGQKLVEAKVLAHCYSGKKKIIKINTRHYNVEVSENHPILTSTRQYKQAKDIEVGDKLVIAKAKYQTAPIEIPIQFNRVKLDSKVKIAVGSRKISSTTGIPRTTVRNFLAGRSTRVDTAISILESADHLELIDNLRIAGYGTQKIPNIPRIVDETFAMFYGYMIGDGWITGNYVSFALGVDEEINHKYINILEVMTGTVTIRRQNGRDIAALSSCKILADTLRAMGFAGKSHEKTLPDWIFNADRDIQIAFVQGLIDSDGCAYLDKGEYLRFWYGSTSEHLIKQLKSLIHQIGFSCGQISRQTNCLSYPDEDGNRHRWQITWYQTELEFNESDVLNENVISIEHLDEEDTYDIQVDHPASNFVANNVVVHNSILDGARKHFKQLRLMEDAALVYRICVRGDTKVWTPSGYKEIKDIKEGDTVYTYCRDGSLKETKVVYWKCNGKDKIYRIYSRHRELYANATHPILVVNPYKKNGKWHYDKLEYVDVKDLKTRQNCASGSKYIHKWLLPQLENVEYVKLKRPDVPKYAVMRKAISNISPHRIRKHTKCKSRVENIASFCSGKWPILLEHASDICDLAVVEHDYDVVDGWSFDCQSGNVIEYDIPYVADEDFARWFGFMLADGFVSERAYTKNNTVTRNVGFALGEHDDVNEKYKLLFEKYVGKVRFENDTGHRLGAYLISSKHFVKFLLLNGFIPGKRNKRVPEWVYQSSPSVQEAFIDGFVDGDGTGAGDNRGRIFKGGKTRAYEVESCNQNLLEDLKEVCHRLGWDVGLVRTREREGGHIIDRESGRKMPPTTAYYLYFTKKRAAEYENILDVEDTGEHELVYDIGVEAEEHNFIANGVPISNTRAPEKRVFTIPVGSIPAKDVPQYIELIAKQMKKKRFFDPASGDVNERWHPLIQEDDFWMPERCVSWHLKVPLVNLAKNTNGDHDVLGHNQPISLLSSQEYTVGELVEKYGHMDKEFWVYSYKDGKIIPAKAKACISPKNQQMVRVTLDNDEFIECTPDHKFMLRDETWVEAKDLKPGDSLMPLYRRRKTSKQLGLTPNNHKVVSVEWLEERQDTYCLVVPETKCFFVSAGVLIHNSDGVGPKVDVLPGAQNLDEIADIEYFKKKMISALKIPFARVGIGEGDEGSSEPLYKVSPEFSKAVHYIQKALVISLSKVAIIHLILRGYNANDIRNFDIYMTTASAIDELYRMETWATRAGVMESLKNLELFPDEWILRRFTEMSDDEIEQMKQEQEEQEQEAIEAGKELGLATAGLGDIAGGGIGGLPPLEGLDADLEKKVLTEYNELQTGRKLVKYGKITESYNNYFDTMLNNEELSKLPYEIVDDKNKEKTVIIESSLNEDDRKNTREEVKKLLIESRKMISMEDTEDDEISDKDLPL